MPSLPPSGSHPSSSLPLKRKRSKSRPWSGSPSLPAGPPEASGSSTQAHPPAAQGEGEAGVSKKRKRKEEKKERRKSAGSRAAGAGGGEVKEEEEEVEMSVELGGENEEGQRVESERRSRFFSAPAQAGPSSSASTNIDKKGKGKARASSATIQDEPAETKKEKKARLRSEAVAASSQSQANNSPEPKPIILPPPIVAPALPADNGASNALRERARRMKEVEDAARERVAKETEVKELKAREDRLGKEIKFKDSELEAQKDTLGNVSHAVTCGICLELLWQPYILSPCGHTACYTCLKSWFLSPPPPDQPLLPPRQREKTCPNCRGVVDHTPTIVYAIKDLVHAIAPKLTLDGGGAAVQPEPEGPEPWKGIFEDGEVRRRGMRDEEDGVERCVECGYEILDGECVNCGAAYLENDDSDGEFQADDLVGFIYGNGVDNGGAGPEFEFEDDDDDDEGDDVELDLNGDYDDEEDRYDEEDDFLVRDDEVEASGTETDEGSELEGDDLDEETTREILMSKGASEAMIDRFRLTLRGHHILALLPQALFPTTPHRLIIKNDIHLPPTDPYGARFLLTYLRGSRSGRAWLRKEKEARSASRRAGGRRSRGEREFSLESFASDEGSEGGDEEEEGREAERERRSMGVEPSLGRRTVDLSDSDEEEEQEDSEEEEEMVGRRSRSSSTGGGGGRMMRSRRRMVESSDEDEDEEDVELSVGGGRAGGARRVVRGSGSRARNPRIASSSPSHSPSLSQTSTRSHSHSDPDPDSDAPSSDSTTTARGLARLRSLYGASAAAILYPDGDQEDDLEEDDDGLNMLGDGGRNDEGPDEPWYGEEDGFGGGAGEDGGVMDDEEGDYY